MILGGGNSFVAVNFSLSIWILNFQLKFSKIHSDPLEVPN